MSQRTVRTSTQPPVGYVELLRDNRNFRYLWFGQIVSLLGDWFNLIASAALVGALTQSGLAIGSLFVVRMLAPFVVSPIAGVVADRYNRKHILIASDLVRVVVVFAFLLVRDAADIWLLYALTAAQLGLSGFFEPARNAILPDIAEPRALGAANALSSATWSVMLALGAALGGLISGTWGIYPAFVLDGLTFLLSAALLTQVRLQTAPTPNPSVPLTSRPAPPLGVPDTPGFRQRRANQQGQWARSIVTVAVHQYIDGLRYLREHLDILIITLQKAINSFFLSAGFQVLQVTIAQQIFVIGEGGGISLGLLFALAGVGTGIGPILARKFTGDHGPALRKAIAAGYLIGGLGLVVTAPLFSLPLVLLGTILRGLGGGIIWVFSTQLLLQAVPGRVQGRVFATDFMFFYLGSALASSLVGAALDTSLSISGVIWWMAGLSIIPLVLWSVWITRGRQEVV